MNKAFLIIGIPAVATSFGWLAFGWGLRAAIAGTAVEVVVIIPLVVYFLRRENERRPARPDASQPPR